LKCIKDLGGIEKGTLACVFRNDPKEKFIWLYINHPVYNVYQFKIPRSLLQEHFICIRSVT
jgi:hypothetical protein